LQIWSLQTLFQLGQKQSIYDELLVPQLGDDVDHNPTRKRGILPEESSLAHAAGWDFGDAPIKVDANLWH
jgi:hypothetical protein